MNDPYRPRPASTRLLYAIDEFNDGIKRAREAYHEQPTCKHCGKPVEARQHRRVRTCDECKRKVNAAKQRRHKEKT